MESCLNFCLVASSQQKATSIEKKLQKLYAEKQYKDHYKKFLDPAITSKSRNISQDIEGLLDALTDNWVRAPVLNIGTSGKADATRVSMDILFAKFTVLDAMLNRPVCMC